jgi:cyclopropane-fatty-acyl-phospholipid synthase
VTTTPVCHPGSPCPAASPAWAWLAQRPFRRLPVLVVLPGGEQLGAGGPAPLMRIERPATLFHRLGVDAKIGFGGSYLAGDWTSTDLAGLLTPFAERVTTLVAPVLQPLRRWVDAARPADERNTVAGARDNIHRHYDLSNDLFAAFLDESMTYSSAWFPAGTDDLHAAQLRKIDSILDLACAGPGTHVLEIGTGWGALAIRAAQRGARVTTLTISREQKELAERRVAAAGVADRVRTRWPPRASTRLFAACGSSTSPTARPGSAPGTSTSGSSA